MSKKEKEKMEFRFYDISPKEPGMALFGDAWRRTYGQDTPGLHFHNVFEIGYCYDGEGELLLEEKEALYKDGMVTMIPANYPHNTISFGEKLNYWEFVFFDIQQVVSEIFPQNPNRQREVLENVNQNAFTFQKGEQEQLVRLVQMYLEEMKKQRTDYKMMAKTLLKAIVIEIIRINKENVQWKERAEKKEYGSHILQVLDYIEINYMNPIKARDLADVCNMSETHFRRKFEEEINMSPMDYVNWIRIKHACDEMCKSNNVSMEMIAIKCGFSTMSTFNRNFNRFLYTSPYKWRQSAQ